MLQADLQTQDSGVYGRKQIKQLLPTVRNHWQPPTCVAFVACRAGSQEITQSDLANATYEFTPARDEQAVEAQELVAACAVASPLMLPELFKAMTTAEMTACIDALRLLMQ